MGPAFSRIRNANSFTATSFDACQTLRSVFNIDAKVECEVTEQREDDMTSFSRIVQRINGYKVLSSDAKINVVKSSGDIIVSGEFYVQPPVHSEVIVTPV